MNQRAAVFFICLLLAIGFWFTTSMSRNYETVITIPVSYRNLPFTRHIEGELPADLKFYFKGTGFELFSVHLKKQPDSIVVDLTSAMRKNGNINLPTDSLKKQFPGDHAPVKIEPEIINPDIATRMGKKVPVILKSQISYRERFKSTGKIILRPDSIDIAGPQEMLDKVNSITTDNLVLEDLHKDHFGGVQLAKNLPKGVQLSQPYIHYFIPIVEYTEGSVEIPIELPASQRNKITLLPSKVKITYQVELSRYNEISSDDFIAYTEFNSSNLPNNLEVKLRRIPYHLINVKTHPRFVDYLFKE